MVGQTNGGVEARGDLFESWIDVGMVGRDAGGVEDIDACRTGSMNRADLELMRLNLCLFPVGFRGDVDVEDDFARGFLGLL